MLCPTRTGRCDTDFKMLSSLSCKIFLHLCCIGLVSGVLSAGFRPASSAGNTTECALCASHCPTPGMCWRCRVHTGSVTLLRTSLWGSHAHPAIFTHFYFASFCCWASSIIRNPDAGCTPHLKPINMSAFASVWTYISGEEQKSCDINVNKKGLGGVGGLSKWKKKFSVSWTWSLTVPSAKKGSHWSQSQRDWKNLLPHPSVCGSKKLAHN